MIQILLAIWYVYEKLRFLHVHHSCEDQSSKLSLTTENLPQSYAWNKSTSTELQYWFAHSIDSVTSLYSTFMHTGYTMGVTRQLKACLT